MSTGRPYPPSEADAARCRIGEVRLRMLEGAWRPDLDTAICEFFAPEVIARIESARDISRQPFTSAINSINTLYLDTPTASAKDAPDLSPLLTPDLWAARQQGQLYVLGMGEAATRLDFIREAGGGGRIAQRAVPGCMLEVRVSRTDPRELVWVRETAFGEDGWTRETHGLNEAYLVERYDGNAAGGWRDITDQRVAIDDAWQPGQPLYRDRGGKPIIPYELHHLMLGRATWSPHRWSELVQGQLYTGCLRTFWLAGYRDNAYPIRVGIDVTLPTARPEGGPGAGPQRVLLDPSVFLEIHTRSGVSGTGSVTTLQPTMNIGEALKGIDDYVAGALQDAGLGPSDEAPAKGVSGHAIMVSREARRNSQRQQTPAARLGDQRLLATAARMWNQYGGDRLPEQPSAYSLSYHGIPLSTEEVRSAVDRASALLTAGLTTRWRAIRETHPQMSDDEARALVLEIDAERDAEEKRRAARNAPPPPPTPEPDVEDPEDAELPAPAATP